MEFKTIISAKGEMMLPKAIMQALKIKPEDEVTMVVKEGNKLEIRATKTESTKKAANTSNPEVDLTTLTILETSML